MTYDNVQIVQRLAPGGIEVLALRLSRALPGRNAIVSLEGDAEGLRHAWPLLAASGVDVFAMEKADGIDPGMPWRLRAFLRTHRPRAVFTHHIGPLLYGGLAARLAGTRNIIHVEHDIWHHAEPRRAQQLRLAAAIVRPTFAAISPAAAAALRRTTGVRTVVLLPNGVDLAAYAGGTRQEARATLGLPPHARVIGTVGRLETVKGHDVLIRALEHLPVDVCLALIGDGGRREELEGLARQLGLSDRIRFAGHRDDVARLYPAFDVFCLPSRREGVPLAVIEAQASGVPVVATDVGSVRDALCPETARLVPPEDPAALAQALDAALTSCAAVSPRAFVERSFDWDATVRRYTILAKG